MTIIKTSTNKEFFSNYGDLKKVSVEFSDNSKCSFTGRVFENIIVILFSDMLVIFEKDELCKMQYVIEYFDFFQGEKHIFKTFDKEEALNFTLGLSDNDINYKTYTKTVYKMSAEDYDKIFDV